MKIFKANVFYVSAIISGALALPLSGNAQSAGDFVRHAYKLNAAIAFSKNNEMFSTQVSTEWRSTAELGDASVTSPIACAIKKSDVNPGEQITIRATNDDSVIVLRHVWSSGNTRALMLYRAPLVDGVPALNRLTNESALGVVSCRQTIITGPGTTFVTELPPESALRYISSLFNMEVYEIPVILRQIRHERAEEAPTVQRGI